MATPHMSDTHSGDAYEHTDAHIGPVVKFLVWLFVGTALVLVAMWAMLEGMKQMPLPESRVELHPLALERTVPSEPHLEAQSGITKGVNGELIEPKDTQQYFNTKMWKDWREKWKGQLSSYEYVDQAAGIVRVPIERAMELKLKKGFQSVTKPKN